MLCDTTTWTNHHYPWKILLKAPVLRLAHAGAIPQQIISTCAVPTKGSVSPWLINMHKADSDSNFVTQAILRRYLCVACSLEGLGWIDNQRGAYVYGNFHKGTRVLTCSLIREHEYVVTREHALWCITAVGTPWEFNWMLLLVSSTQLHVCGFIGHNTENVSHIQSMLGQQSQSTLVAYIMDGYDFRLRSDSLPVRTTTPCSSVVHVLHDETPARSVISIASMSTHRFTCHVADTCVSPLCGPPPKKHRACGIHRVTASNVQCWWLSWQKRYEWVCGHLFYPHNARNIEKSKKAKKQKSMRYPSCNNI